MKQLLKNIFLAYTLLFLPFLERAQAGDLKPPVDLSSAKVLPKGVRNLRYKGVLVNGNDKYSNTGSTELLADPFFKKLTWYDILDPKTDATGKGTLEGYLKANNHSLSEEVGSTTGAISVAATGHAPILAYGITPRFTLAVAVPYVQYKVNVNTSFIATENANNVGNQLRNDRKTYELAEYREKLQDPIATKARDFNYKPLVNEKGTKLQDMKVVGKFLVTQSEKHIFTLQPEVTLPTGKKADIDKIVDPATGDGQWDLGLSLLNDFYPSENLGFTTSVSYTWQMADTTAKRIPYTQDSALTPDFDSQVKRDLGDIFLAQAGIKYEFLKGFNFNTGYAFQMKDKDRYQGSKYDQARYQWLETNTRQRLQTAQFGTGYSTLRRFQEKTFPIPLEANITYTRPLAGKSVAAREAQTTLEFAMFF